MQNLIVDINRVWDEGATMPITLAEAKKHLIVDHSLDDDYITELIEECISEVEQWCGIAIVPQTVTLIGDYYSRFALPYGPVTELTTVETADKTGYTSGIPTYTALDEGWSITGNTFYRYGGSTTFRVSTVYNDHRHRWVYAAGSETISKGLKRAILGLIAFRYENRDDQRQEMSDNLIDQLNKYKDYSWG